MNRIELGSGPVLASSPRTGVPALDQSIDGLLWGDNLVWRIDVPGRDAGFGDALVAAGADVEEFSGVIRVAVDTPLPDDLESLIPDGSLVVIDLRDGSSAFDAARLVQHVFERRVVAYWFVSADADTASWLTMTQCIIVVEGTHLRVQRADGRRQGTRNLLLPHRVELDDGEPRLVVARARTGALLGRGLRTLRQARGWSQSELGALIGVSGSAISQAERGLASLSLETAMELTERLGVSMDNLLRGPTDSYELHRGALGAESIDAQVWRAPSAPGSGLRAITMHVPPFATVGAGFGDTAGQILLVAQGRLEAVVADDRPLLRDGDRLHAATSAIRSVRNLTTEPALLFWLAFAP